MDNQSISWMWQVTGCQHSLQPQPDNDFAPPCIPALTPRGFSRWEALEILLGPEEHVPFLQYAVRNWRLRHPETGEPFPEELPKDLFPLQADPDVDRWHQTCGEKLREDATQHQKAEDSAKEAKAKATPPEHPEPKYAYVDPFKGQKGPHSRPTPHRTSRPFSYVHVPGRHPHPSHRPARSPDRDAREPPPDEPRRRSFSDYSSPIQERTPPQTSHSGSAFLDPNAARPGPAGRRHSHPRPYSSDESEPEPPRPPPQARRRSPPPSNRRHAAASAPQPPVVNNGRPPRSDRVDGGLKRNNGNSPLGSIRDKLGGAVSGIFGSGRSVERPRTDSRQSSYIESPRPRQSPPRRHQSQRIPHRFSDVDSTETSDPETEEDDIRRRRRAREERQKEYHRDGRDSRGRPYELDRELDDDIDDRRRGANRPPPRRPDPYRRTSSHADIDRRRDQPVFDPRGRNRFRDDRRRFDRRSPEDRESTSPMTGVSGRRYPSEAAYA